MKHVLLNILNSKSKAKKRLRVHQKGLAQFRCWMLQVMQDLKFHQKHFHGNCTTNQGFYFGESYEKDAMAKIQRKRHGYKDRGTKTRIQKGNYTKTEIERQIYKDRDAKKNIQRQRYKDKYKKTEIQRQRYKDRDTKTKIQRHEYKDEDTETKTTEIKRQRYVPRHRHKG